jgi:hypothetical protein
VRPLAVLRRSLMSPNGIGRVVASWAADAGGLGRLARSRDVALVHTNTSVTLGGAAAARVAGVPHVWHVREIYAGFERWFPGLPATAAQRPGAAVRLACRVPAVRWRTRGLRAPRRPRGRGPPGRPRLLDEVQALYDRLLA